VTETEIKLHWDGTAEEARALIETKGYVMSEPRTLENDQLFDLISGDLRQSDRILRLRRTVSPEGGPHTMVTYKGAAKREGYKSREEIEFDVSDPDALMLVLDRLGYYPGFRYEKYRTKFAARDEPGIITLDETPIGIYLELEGPQYWIDSTAARLDFPVTRFLNISYAALYRKYREQHPDAPAHMIFDSTDPYTSATKLP
jgi:adenylate cyclase class 2